MQGFRFFSMLGLVLMLAATFVIAPLNAQDRTLPYWASLRYEKVNMRVGPSAEYPVTWVYLRQGLPVKVVRVREGWRWGLEFRRFGLRLRMWRGSVMCRGVAGLRRWSGATVCF